LPVTVPEVRRLVYRLAWHPLVAPIPTGYATSE
jgi:hypothetical protein